MDIAQYISDILKRHDEVSLPGIGTFSKKYSSAGSHQEEGSYYPPSHQIRFSNTEGTASRLVDHIIAVKHISEASAIYFIDRFIDSLKSGLERDEKADISPLGTLTKTENGYQLESSAFSSPDFFGLKPVKEQEVILDAPKSVPTNYKAASTTAEPELLEEEFSSPGRNKWITLLIILLVAAVAAFAWFYYPKYIKGSKEPEKKKKSAPVVAPAVDPLVDSMAIADSIMFSELQKEGLEAEKTPDTLSITTTTTKPDTVIIPSTTYEIIAASTDSRAEAERSIRNYRKKGVDAKIVEDKKKPKFKVSIGTFTSKRVANREIVRVKKEILKDAWIMEIKNNKK